MTSTLTATRLVADIGGTNARLALFDPRDGSLRHRHDFENAEFDSLEAVIERWIAQLQEPAPTQACLAVAAPPFDDRVEMLNLNWTFSIAAVAQRFGFEAIRCINDFESNAYALPHLTAGDLETIHPGIAGATGKLAAVGPGTGLGGAAFGLVDGRPVASASEPGHMSLAAVTAVEQAAFGLLLKTHPDVYAELLLSGPGIVRLYETLAQVMGEEAPPLTAAQITARATDTDCELCAETMATFCALLGSLCGDYVLAQGAYGGLYLCGGILPRMLPLLTQSTFHTRFVTKGGMQAHLEDVPVYVVTSGAAGLLGAAHTPL